MTACILSGYIRLWRVTEVTAEDKLISSLDHTLNLVIQVSTKMRPRHHTSMLPSPAVSHYSMHTGLCVLLCVAVYVSMRG